MFPEKIRISFIAMSSWFNLGFLVFGGKIGSDSAGSTFCILAFDDFYFVHSF